MASSRQTSTGNGGSSYLKIPVVSEAKKETNPGRVSANDLTFFVYLPENSNGSKATCFTAMTLDARILVLHETHRMFPEKNVVRFSQGDSLVAPKSARNQELEFQQQCHVQVPVFYFIIFWLVVSTPLKNMSSSVGIIVPNI